MQRGDSHGEVAEADLLEAGRGDHLGEAFLVGEAADRFDEVLIAPGRARG
jgi:hypothetical protein